MGEKHIGKTTWVFATCGSVYLGNLTVQFLKGEALVYTLK